MFLIVLQSLPFCFLANSKSIAYGKRLTVNEKEKDYVQQIKSRAKKLLEIEEQSEKIEVKGFFMAKKLLNREVKIICSVCENKLRTVRDDIYMNKFDCCEKCFVDYVEDREERWLKGWRPNQGEN